MQASIPSIFGQIFVFILFIVFTMKYVWPPITSALEERRQKIADGLASAEKGAQALKEASARSDEAVKEARVQAQEILSSASRQAAQLIEQAKAQAEAEKARIVESGHAEVERDLAQAREALRRQVADLAVLGAARILKREINAEGHSDVIADLAARI